MKKNTAIKKVSKSKSLHAQALLACSSLLSLSSLAVIQNIDSRGLDIHWEQKTFELSNTLNIERENEVVCIKLSDLNVKDAITLKQWHITDFLVSVETNSSEDNHTFIASQVFNCPSQNNALSVGVKLNFAPREIKKIKVQWLPGITHVHAVSHSLSERWATGIVKHNVERMTYVKKDSAWNYLATWGKQSLNNDDLAEITRDDVNELVVLKAKEYGVNYYFASQWSALQGGIKTREGFIEYLSLTLKKLNTPISVKSL